MNTVHDTGTIIVGQGICGTLLGWELYKGGKPFFVIDNGNPSSAGRVASGLINPVTGMRLAKAWRIDELLPVAIATYRELEEHLGISILQAYPLIEFFQNEEGVKLFAKRATEYPQYLEPVTDASRWEGLFHLPHGAGVIHCYLVNIRLLLAAWRQWLVVNSWLLEESVDWEAFHIREDHFRYRHQIFQHAICCEGAGVRGNPYFRHYQFAHNKGEALLLDIPGLPSEAIYHSGLKIAPWEQGRFWVGSSFQWAWDNELPTQAFRDNTEHRLSQWLKLPYTVTGHLVSVRPATVDRLPFAEWHPAHPGLGIFNGMGAKGCSQAPYFAHKLADQL